MGDPHIDYVSLLIAAILVALCVCLFVHVVTSH